MPPLSLSLGDLRMTKLELLRDRYAVESNLAFYAKREVANWTQALATAPVSEEADVRAAIADARKTATQSRRRMLALSRQIKRALLRTGV